MSEQEARAAMAQGQVDAQHRRDWYTAHPEGVPATSSGEPANRPLPLPDDPAVTGVRHD